VKMTVAHFRDVVEEIALVTFEDLKIGPNLPIDFSPRDSVSFSSKSDEFLQIPGSIDNMFSSNLSVIINIGFTLRAMKDLSLTHRK
jgi:hypothetical protein